MAIARLIGRMGCTIPVAILLWAGIAPAQEEHRDRTLSPYFFVEGGDSRTDHLPLLGTHVSVNVAGVIAEVTVRQTYKNDGQRPIHARYVFPASTRAAVHGLTMTVGDERVTARIKEREKARSDFAAAKKAGKNAALLEEQRPNVFSMEVANLVPGERIDVELSYSERLVPTAGVYEFVYPTVVGPRYSTVPEAGAASSDLWLRTPYTPAGVPPLASFSLEGTLAAAVPVHELASPSHAVLTRWVSPTRAEFSLDPAVGAAADRDFVLHYRLEGDRLQSGLSLYRGADENFFMATIQPPRRVLADDIPPREYVFVVDVSGSMQGFPLNTAKVLLRDLIGHLRPSDTFNVLLFSGGSQLMAPRSVSATPDHVARAIALIEEQNGGGGTELRAAVERAMSLPRDEEGRSRSILIITDGYIGAEREVFTSIREQLDRANVFAFGIGSGVNRHLIEGLARAGMGEPFVAMNQEQAPASAARFREYVRHPLLTHVHVACEGFQAYDIQPAAIPDVLAERPIVVTGKWRGEPHGQLVLTGSSGAGAYRQTLDVAAVVPDTANHVLRMLWARERIEALSDFGDSQETEEQRRELVSLGLTYNLLTRHTSFIAVHERVRNPLADGNDVTQALPLPLGVSNSAIGGMEAGDEPGLVLLCAAMLAAALCDWLRRQAVAAGR